MGKKLIQPVCTQAQQNEGIRLIARAVTAQHPEAMFTLGTPLIRDAAKETEEQLGLDYIEQSAQLGHTHAAAFLGAHLMSVSRTEDQRDQAFLWLGLAANDGSVLAAMTLSQLYKSGMHGVVQDRCAAALWRETAGLLQNPDMDFSPQTDVACK
ncbi:sel1 repeat family protein [Tateyamaria sp. syn59]|uniref:sel1 repeat family protein n=1 Tax=Tateyamaria sp. syn59 TaxID=2576942 RepID=UPI00167C13BB|nr:sel1 repeat family protein [Tateyamaria sp. syn59]